MQNIFNDIKNRTPTLRNVETRVQTPGGEVFLEQRTSSGGFAGIENPQPRTARVPGFIYDFTPDIQMAEIVPGLYLGSQDVAWDYQLMKSKGVTHIINASLSCQNHYPEDFIYKNLDLLDVPNENIQQHFVSSIEFIDGALSGSGVIYVHCNAGVSRSTSICLAYLIARKGMRLKEALAMVRKVRPIVRPNDGFMTQLKTFERETLGSQ